MRQRLLSDKGKTGIAFNQEYSVFTTLAPKKLIDLFEAEEISFPEYYKLLCMLKNCNFKELSLFHRCNPNHSLNEEDAYIFENGTDEEVEQLIPKHNWDFDDSEYILLFHENIKSESLRKIF